MSKELKIQPNTEDEGVIKNTSTEQSEISDQETKNAIPYARFKEVNEKAKQLELKLKEIEQTQVKAEADRKEAELKAKGDYESLANNLKLKETENAAATLVKEQLLKQKYGQLEMERLGSQYGIAKTEYLNIFTGKFEVSDDLQIT